MAVSITKDNLFRPVRPGPQTKADITNNIARAIIQAEVDSREAKTQRLRQARLRMEAQQPKPAPTKDRSRKVAGRMQNVEIS